MLANKSIQSRRATQSNHHTSLLLPWKSIHPSPNLSPLPQVHFPTHYLVDEFYIITMANETNSTPLTDPASEPLLLPVSQDGEEGSKSTPLKLPLTTSEIRIRIISASWPQASVVACRLATDLTDVAILGHLGTDELAGSAFAGVVKTISSVVLWQGFGNALITLSSQAVGAGNPKLAETWLQTSILCCTVGSIPIAIIWWFAGDLLAFAPCVDPNVVHYAQLCQLVHNLVMA